MLKVYTGNRLDDLLLQMDQNITAGCINPLAKVPVCIQTPGMQRWIGINLARLTGISANLDFIFPGALMKRLAGVGAGEKAPWAEKDDLVWRVMNALLSLPDENIYKNINNYLKDDTNGIRSFRLARRVADIFDQYQIYRPDMVLGWLRPKAENLPDEESDLWQPEIFRKIFNKTNSCKTSVFDKTIRRCKTCYEGTENTVHVFGISVLPKYFIDMLKAASKHIDICFYLLNPSMEYWGDSLTNKEKRWREKRQPDAEFYELHELLDNLGVIGRDFFDYIYSSDDEMMTDERFEEIQPVSLLSSIQHEILHLSRSESKPSNDGSIIINNCHNPLRELETLYDTLLNLFNNDKTLEASDILIMTPEIESYAPYIKSVFDNPYGERERIPYSIADVSEKQVNKPAGIFLELLDTIRGDFTLSDVGKLMANEPVADKFGINSADLSTITNMLNNAGAFWGYGAEHLKAEGLRIDDKFTWERALRRISLGLAEGNTSSIYNDASAMNVPFSMSAQIGGLMHFADLAKIYAYNLTCKKTVSEWCADLQAMVQDFLHETFENADDILYLNKCITDINTEAEKGGFDKAISSEPVLERLTEKLNETRGAKGFISGRVTFCAMLPMRSIPFKVICIIGLNENTFPRQKSSLEFDLMAKHPVKGDRNNRDSDRYLFLETLISAKERLILSYVGQSERDNKELPPSTLITELTTHISSRFGIDDIISKQKLHSFSKDYFKNEKLFTYSANKYNTAIAFSSAKSEHKFCTEMPDVDDVSEVSISDFENFFISPPEQFLKKTLGIRPKMYDDALPETEVLSMDSLRKYGITNEALSERLAGKDPDKMLEYLYETAQLPLENLGTYHMAETKISTAHLAEKALETLGGLPEDKSVDIEVDGLRITGKVSGVSGDKHVYMCISSIKPKYIMRGWIRHLLLNSIHPTKTTVMTADKPIEFQPVNTEHLKVLASYFRQGQKLPIKFHITDAMDYLTAKKPYKTDEFNNMGADYAYRICYGRELRLDMDAVRDIISPIADLIGGGK